MNGLRRANGNGYHLWYPEYGRRSGICVKKPAYDGMRIISLVQAHWSMQERVKFTKPGGTAG